MRNPWNALRRLFHSHSWEPVEVDGDKGWKCRNCEEFLLEREYVERVHDPEVADRSATSHSGAGAGTTPPF